MKRSECSNTICCLFEKPVFLRDKSQCKYQVNPTKTTYTQEPFDCSVGDQKIKMTNISNCYKAINDYWNNKPFPTFDASNLVLPTKLPNQPTITKYVKTVDQAACRTQYNDEVRFAQARYGGDSIAEAMTQIALQSFYRCMSTGIVENNIANNPNPEPTTAKGGCYGGCRPEYDPDSLFNVGL